MPKYLFNATRKHGRWSPKKGNHKGLRIKMELEVTVLMRNISRCGLKAPVDRIFCNLFTSGFTVFNFVA